MAHYAPQDPLDPTTYPTQASMMYTTKSNSQFIDSKSPPLRPTPSRQVFTGLPEV